jgi:hypothetical protein
MRFSWTSINRPIDETAWQCTGRRLLTASSLRAHDEPTEGNTERPIPRLMHLDPSALGSPVRQALSPSTPSGSAEDLTCCYKVIALYSRIDRLTDDLCHCTYPVEKHAKTA